MKIKAQNYNQRQLSIDDLNKNDGIIELENSIKKLEGQVKSLKRRNSYLSDKIEIQETKKIFDI